MDKQTLLELYRMMVRIRAFENETIELAKSNATRAAVHTYNGQEAIAAGICHQLTHKDYITSTHRGHGHCVAKGADLELMFAELLGRQTGYCRGKGGSMHIADLATGNLGANGIVGGGIPLATGAALGMQIRKDPHVVVSFFGDGASNQGSFHESLNMASIWRLPVVYVCENNKYGISTHVNKSTNVERLSDRAKAYGIKGETVDGNDVVQVYRRFAAAKADVLTGNGPILLEMDTYRMNGHYFGDNQNYRTKDEVESWKSRDPIARCGALLEAEHGMPPEELAAMQKKEKKRVLEASERAKEAPEPPASELLECLYHQELAPITWVPFVKGGGVK